MRSTVVWLCFAIVILCALSAESGVRKGYQLIHGHATPIYRSIVPTTGYRSVGPKMLARRTQQAEYTEEDDDTEEDDEEDDDNEPDYSTGYPVAGPNAYPYPPYEDEEEEDDEEEETEEQDEQDVEAGRETEGRQAYVNNNYVEGPYTPRQYNARPQNNRPVRPNNRQPVRPNNNRAPNRQNNRRPARPGYNGNRVQPQRGGRPQPIRRQQGNNQRLQVRPVASSTQFIATPVADLILRLSISLAKPIGPNANRKRPVRIQHDDDENSVGDKNVIDLGMNELEDESQKIESIPIKMVSVENHVNSLGEGEDKKQTSAVTVTEQPRK